MNNHEMPEYFHILIDIDPALNPDFPYFSDFIDTNIEAMNGLGKTIKCFLDHGRDFMVIHMTPNETQRLGYFERCDCLIFG